MDKGEIQKRRTKGRFDEPETWSGDESLANSKVNMVAFTESKTYGKARVDAHWCAIADVEVTTAEIASDSSGLFFSKVARPFVRAEGRARSTRKSTAVIVVLLVVEAGGTLQCGIHWRRGKLDGVGC